MMLGGVTLKQALVKERALSQTKRTTQRRTSRCSDIPLNILRRGNDGLPQAVHLSDPEHHHEAQTRKTRTRGQDVRHGSRSYINSSLGKMETQNNKVRDLTYKCTQLHKMFLAFFWSEAGQIGVVVHWVGPCSGVRDSHELQSKISENRCAWNCRMQTVLCVTNKPHACPTTE